VFIAIIEGSKYVIRLQIYLDFLVQNLLWRILVYLLFSIAMFFSFVSIVAGVFLLISSGAYGFCWWRGETGPSVSTQPHDDIIQETTTTTTTTTDGNLFNETQSNGSSSGQGRSGWLWWRK